MSNPMVQLQEATIKAQCKTLRWRSRRFARSRAISDISKHYCWPRSKSANATRLNAASGTHICHA